MITVELLREAYENTEWHREQIQGFCYRAETSDRHMHVVRDVSLSGKSWLWSEAGAPAEYDATHERMMKEIERVRLSILTNEINRLGGQLCQSDERK